MSIFSKLSYISRKKKLEMFYTLMKPTYNKRVLDIGAEINPTGDHILQLIDSYPWKEKLTAINNSSQHIKSINNYYPQIKTVIGDACRLPWPDKYFDIIYSNAVIEHVGTFKRQQLFASEIMRVGKKWFVTTPNRWYPFEFHYRLPFVTWLPGHGYLWVSNIISYNHIRKKYCILKKRKSHNLRLLSMYELQKCFPTSNIIKQKITFMTETLIAIDRNIS